MDIDGTPTELSALAPNQLVEIECKKREGEPPYPGIFMAGGTVVGHTHPDVFYGNKFGVRVLLVRDDDLNWTFCVLYEDVVSCRPFRKAFFED